MSECGEVIIVPDRQDGYAEDGVVVTLDRINPEALRKMGGEFVPREWSELSDALNTASNFWQGEGP